MGLVIPVSYFRVPVTSVCLFMGHFLCPTSVIHSFALTDENIDQRLYRTKRKEQQEMANSLMAVEDFAKQYTVVSRLTVRMVEVGHLHQLGMCVWLTCLLETFCIHLQCISASGS